jgi:hypothetical protein
MEHTHKIHIEINETHLSLISSEFTLSLELDKISLVSITGEAEAQAAHDGIGISAEHLRKIDPTIDEECRVRLGVHTSTFEFLMLKSEAEPLCELVSAQLKPVVEHLDKKRGTSLAARNGFFEFKIYACGGGLFGGETV